MEIKRTILAVVLSMAVLLLFQKYMAPPPKAPPPAAQPGEGPAQPAPQVPTAVPAAVPTAPGDAPPAAAQAPLTTAVLENELVSVETSSRAAALVSAKLKRFRDKADPEGSPVKLLNAPSGFDFAGATRLFASMPQAETLYEQVEKSARRVVYAHGAPSGLRIEKTFELNPGRYDVSLSVRLQNLSDQAVRDRLGLVLVQDFGEGTDRYSFQGPAYFRDGKYEEVKLKKVKDGVQETGDIDWVALLEKYFLVAALPESAEGNGLTIDPYMGMEKVARLSLDTPVFDLPAGAEKTFTYRIYLGPKQADTLAPLGSHMEELVHYGFFHVIAKPLAWFLNAIYGITGNYGVAIIILTTVIKAVFWPLSARSFSSMQRMKELQPKMQRLKERYGNDRERLNREVMQLYKTHKVNPLGGCLPMVVQIPFFFALYKILLGSIELRHAPFVFWIQDLAAKDPYYITPLLMGASMFLQQKMTPVSGGNEAQMKMMMYGMPIVFTFLFLNFPSGLVIYWLVNNVLSIAQQAMMLRKTKAA